MLRNMLPDVGANVSSESFTFITEENDVVIGQKIAEIVVSYIFIVHANCTILVRC